MPSRQPTRLPILSAAAANGVGTARMITDFQHVMIELRTANSADMTVRFQGSLAPIDSPPDFNAAASATNPWDYIAVFDYQDPTLVIKGDDGIAFSGTDDVRNLMANIDGLFWLNVEISNYVAGNITATAVAYNNQ